MLLRRLAVFAGGATLEAAERVCAVPASAALAADEVLYLLAGLVDKSLVVAEGDGPGVRYRMLETVRAYGAERLQAAGEDEALARAHAGYFLELAEAAEPERAAGTSCAGSPGWPPSATTCMPPCAGPSTAGRRPRPCGWPPPSAGTGS